MHLSVDGKMKVAVIGAGAAGLCAAKHLSLEPDKFEFVVFEQQSDVGGTWRYTRNVGLDDFGLPIHSSMYENLRTNLPKEVMAFPEFPFPELDGQSFIHHTVVLKYLEDYALKYNLRKHIKFLTVVKNVQPVNLSSPDPKWIVEVENISGGEESVDTYDSVMVCNGHYSVPCIPTIQGMDNYAGLLMHSHDYRNNAPFRNFKVVVLGAGASGIDIAIEIAATAKEVILSHNLPVRTCPLPNNLIQEPGIIAMDKDSVTFSNQKTYNCDAVLLCTGYLYTYPFLHEDCNFKIGDQHVEPLFKHLFHIKYPTLGIWAVPKQIVPFPIYDQQCIVFLKFLKGEISLPSFEEMEKDTERDFSSRLARGMKARHAHVMSGNLQWEYDDQVSVLGNIPPISNAVRNLFKFAHGIRKQDVLNYKNFNFKIVDEETFVKVEK